MSEFKERYGFTGKDVNNLNRRWHDNVKTDCEWENFDSFVFWCSVAGYQKGKQLRKKNPDLPHSADNSFWYDYKTAKKVEQEEKKKRREAKSDFCASCDAEKTAVCINGCAAWREQFIRNWNENICIKKPEQQPKDREVFCYEHPDLEREGIQWRA